MADLADYPFEEVPGLAMDPGTLFASGPMGFGVEYAGLLLHSAFQPIFSLLHRRAVGFEGLIRAADAGGQPVSPAMLFEAARSAGQGVTLDRLCRRLHVHNFTTFLPASAPAAGWLFLNVAPEVAIGGHRLGPFFHDLLQQCQLPPERVVVEVLESASGEGGLREAMAFYRDLGCLVAIDDFGAGHSNFSRLVELQPDIVKLDRALVVRAGSDGRAQRMLHNLVALLHEAGSLVLAEGVESEAEGVAVLDAGVDLVQGWLFGHPLAAPQVSCETAALEQLIAVAGEDAEVLARRDQTLLDGAYRAFEQALLRYAAGQPLAQACSGLLGRADVLRCYQLDDNGIQRGNNLPGRARAALEDPRFKPLQQADGVDWSRRPYFRRALASPGRIRTSRPYFSITDARLCVTLSCTVTRAAGRQVLCCDLVA